MGTIFFGTRVCDDVDTYSGESIYFGIEVFLKVGGENEGYFIMEVIFKTLFKWEEEIWGRGLIKFLEGWNI